VTGATQDTPRPVELSSTGLSPAVVRLSRRVRLAVRVLTGVLQPQRDVSLWFGLIRFRSPLLTESRFLSFPPATKMFQFAGSASGNLGIDVCLTTPPSFSQFATPVCRLVPRHPPQALGSLAALTPISLTQWSVDSGQWSDDPCTRRCHCDKLFRRQALPLPFTFIRSLTAWKLAADD
jgi:hypothetical protein